MSSFPSLSNCGSSTTPKLHCITATHPERLQNRERSSFWLTAIRFNNDGYKAMLKMQLHLFNWKNTGSRIKLTTVNELARCADTGRRQLMQRGDIEHKTLCSRWKVKRVISSSLVTLPHSPLCNVNECHYLTCKGSTCVKFQIRAAVAWGWLLNCKI